MMHKGRVNPLFFQGDLLHGKDETDKDGNRRWAFLDSFLYII